MCASVTVPHHPHMDRLSYRHWLNFWGLCLTKRVKTLEFKTGTLSPCGEIISGRQTLMLSIADMSVSKICTDEHTKSRLFLQAAFVVFNKKNL